MSSIGTAYVDVAFDEKQVSGQVAGLGAKTEGAFGKIGKLGGVALATGIGAAVTGAVAAGKYLYDIGAQFDDMSDTIRTATGATGKQLDELVSSAKTVGTEVPTSFEDAGKAVSIVSQRLGETGRPAEKLSEQMLELARLSGGELEPTLNSVTRMLGDAGLHGEKASEGIDQLWRAAQATGAPVQRLSDLLTKFGGPMRQLGFDLPQTAALLGKFEKEGVNTELVMGSMRIALGKLAKAGKDPVEGLRQTIDAIRNAGSAGEANRKAIELFGARAGPDMAAAIREGRFAIDDLVKQIAGGRDTVLQAGKDTADFSEQWQMFKNKVAVALAPVAAKLFDALGKGMQFVNENAGPAIARLKDELGPVIQDLKPIVQAVGPIFREAFTRAGQVVKDLLPIVKGAAEIIGGVIKTVSALLRGDWAQAWQGAKKIVEGVWDTIKAILTAALHNVEQLLAPFANVAKRIGTAIKEGIVDGVTGVGAFIQSTLNGIRDALSGALASVTNTAKRIGAAIKNGIEDGVTGVGAFILSTLNGIKDALTGALASVTSTARRIGSAIKDGIVQGVTGIGQFIQGTINGIVGAIRGAVGAVASAAAAVGSAIKNGISAGVAGVAGLVSSALAAVRGALATAVFGITSAAAAIGSAIKNGIIAVVTTIPSAVASAVGGIAGQLWGIVKAVGEAAAAIGNAIYNGIMGPVNALVGAVSGVLERIKGIASAAAGFIGKVVPGSAPLPPTAAPGPAPAAAAAAGFAAAPAALGASAGGGGSGLAGPINPLAGVRRAISRTAGQAGGVTVVAPQVRVYIGDEELRSIVRTEVGYSDDVTARVVLAGARFG